MEIESRRSEGSLVLSSGLPLDKQDDCPMATGPPLGKQDDHSTSNGPIVDEQDDPMSSDPPLGKQDDHSTSTCPVVDKDTDHPPSIGCISGFEQDKTCNSTCVNQKAEHKEDALMASVAKKIKQEPGTVRVKEEPIDLDDDDDINSNRKEDEDDDDCIILLEVVHSSQKRKEKPKAASDITEIMIISDDDEDSIKGDEEPTTSSQNETPKEIAETDLTVTSSVSEDIEVNQVKKVTDSSHSLLEQSTDKGDPISKAVCEVVKEFSNHLSASSTDLDGKEKADAHIQSASDIIIAISPAASNGSEKECEDATSSRLGWTEDDLKDAWPFPEPVEEEESTDQANIISGQDEKATGLQKEDVSFGEGYDSDGWEVNSDDEPKKDATKTDENASKRRETEEITERSDKDLSTRQEEGDTNSRPVDIIPVDPDLSNRQDGSLVPIGIIPVASEVITGGNNTAGTGEFGKATLVSPVTKANAAPTEPTQGDSATTAKNDGLPRRKATKASIDEKIRGAVTRSKLRSSSNFVKEMSDNEISCKKSIQQSLREVIQGNSPAVDPVFNCHLCFQSFREKKLLEKHLVNHPEVTRIMCKYCNKSFQKQSYLTVHLKRCYRRKKSKSPRKTLERDPRNFKRVKKEKKDPSGKSDQVSSLKTECRKLNFPSVKKEYNRTNTEGAHRKNATRNNVKHECKICGKIFPEQRHLRIHHTVKHAQNVGSGGKTGDKSQILEGSKDQKHKKPKGSMKSNTPNGVWLCPECHGSFISRNKVKRHIYLAHGLIDTANALEKVISLPKEEAVRLIYYCSTCKESFRSLHMFDRHQNKHKGRKKCVKLYKCNLCLQRFEKKVACAGHVQKHLDLVETRKRKRSSSSSEQQSSLETRRRKRSSSSSEQQSNRKRVKVRDEFKCKYCSKTFELKYLCAKHELTHTDRDPWHCYVCFKIFYLDTSIIAHMKKFHKDVSYCQKCYCIMKSKDKKRCIDCDKRRSGSALKCSICKTEFTEPSDLTHHILTHVENGDETADVTASKASKVSLDPAYQNAPKMSLTKHPVTDSPKKSKKTRSAVNDATRSRKEAGVKPKPTTNTVRDKWSASKASKMSLDPAIQETPKISLTKHPVTDSPKTSKKTKSAVNDATRSKKEAAVKPKPTTNTVLDKWSGLCLVKTSPTDASTSDTLKASSRPMRDGRRVTRSLSGSLPQEAQTTHAIDHAHSKYDVCMKCGERDIPPKELSKHARTHLDVRSRFQCNTCQQCFASMYEIEEHGCAGKHQPSCSYTVSNVVYQCQFCGRDFLNMMEARKHVLTTNTSCLLECTECKAEYSRQGDLMVHMVSIHGQYLECDKCSAQFTRQIDLDYHTRQHEDMSH